MYLESSCSVSKERGGEVSRGTGGCKPSTIKLGASVRNGAKPPGKMLCVEHSSELCHPWDEEARTLAIQFHHLAPVSGDY